MPKPITREDYLAGAVTHRDYYGSVVAAAHIRFAADSPLVQRCAAALANGDEHFNTIPLATWDEYAAAAVRSIATALRQHGDVFSLAGGVCVMKEAARQAVERQAREQDADARQWAHDTPSEPEPDA